MHRYSQVGGCRDEPVLVGCSILLDFLHVLYATPPVPTVRTTSWKMSRCAILSSRLATCKWPNIIKIAAVAPGPPSDVCKSPTVNGASAPLPPSLLPLLPLLPLVLLLTAEMSVVARIINEIVPNMAERKMYLVITRSHGSSGSASMEGGGG